MIHKQMPHSLRIPIYFATIGTLAVVWDLAETMLKGCGLAPGALPSFRVLAAGIIGAPLMELIMTCLASIF